MMNRNDSSLNDLSQQNKNSHSTTVLFEDDYYVVFDKPSGLLVIPTPHKEKSTLVNLVNRERGLPKDQRLQPCHRLDRETSGAIIFAKGERALKLMTDLFRRHQVKKTYIAFVHGRMRSARGEFKSMIADLDQRRYRNQGPRRMAVTRYKVIGWRTRYSIVEVEPVTGQTNQIRIHFSEAGHPLVGDRKYSIVKNYHLKFTRTALHAHRLEWKHPITQDRVIITSELHNDMEVFLARNRN